MTPTVHKEFRKLIPPLSPVELQQLEANILADGCRDPLVVWRKTGDALLLDGHNRLEICQRHKLPFQTVALEFQSDDDACLWIIDNQKGRRNLSEIDRIALQSKREAILARRGKENERQSLGRGKKGLAKLPNLNQVNTRRECAAAAGVGERTYDAGKLILKAAEEGTVDPAIVEKVRTGQKALHAAAKEIKEDRDRRRRQSQRAEAAKAATHDERIIVGDFREHSDRVPDGSLSLIFTDPPYDRKAENMFPALAEFAAAKLAEGGSLLLYIGHLQLPSAFSAFGGKLRHWWTCACVHSGNLALMREYGIRVGWKPILWFVKGTRDDKSNIVCDVVSGGKEKSHHDWQQAETEAAYWIKELCPRDGVVCDPFLGGGTTAVAAEALKRRWVAFEIDSAAANAASKRVGI